MKPPLTVEAKVAEELRTWLATELEQLNASNLNQFAHHVVTILLHEDLDIEDEPLTTGDDFLRDIYNIKNGKTRDKQKKAAVQFLRGAVCCEDPMEEEIQGVVDELMVKIEDMKSKMNSRKSSKRNLLAPIAINVEAPFRQACIKSDGSEEERYNEAFPSLSGEESPCKEGAVPVSSNDSVWSTLSMGKENHRRKKRKSPQQRNKQANATFSSADEAEASAIARRVAALAISESSLPNPEAADVPSASKGSLSMMTNHPRCWKSAFMPRTLTRIFRPIQTPVIFMESREACQITTPKTFSAIILQRFCEPLDECLECTSEPQKTAKSLDAFIPIKDVGSRSRTTEKDLQSSDKITESDLEVETIFTWAKHREEKARRHEKKQGKGKSESVAWVQAEVNLNQRSSETFSNHFGAFWQRLIHCGAIVLYPELNTANSCGGQSCPMASNTEVAEGHQDCFTTRHTKSHESPVQRSFSDCLNLSHDDSKGHFDGSTFGDCGFADYRKESYSTESFLIRPQSEDIQEVSKFVDVLLADDTDEPGNQNVSRCSYKTLTPNVEDFFPSESLQFGYGQNSRVQQPLQPWESLWSKTAWDNIQEDLLSDLKLQRRSFKDNSGVNVFMPSMLSSCLTSRGDQLLQSAYVNSFFANSFLSRGPGSESKKGLQCSEVEKYLFSNVRDLSNNSPGFPAPMIRGQTCSGWLENNCTLGLLCPFSHPSI